MSLSLSLSRLSLGAARGGGVPPVSIAFAADATGTLDTATPPAGYSLPGTAQTVTLSASGYGDEQVEVSSLGAVTENVSSNISGEYASLPVGSTVNASGPIDLVRDSDSEPVVGTLVASIAGALDIELEADLSQIEVSSQTLAEGSTVTLSAPGVPSTNYTITGGNAEFVAGSTGVGYLNLPDGVGLQRDLTDAFSVLEFGAFVHASVASDASAVEVANVTSRSGTGSLVVTRQTDGTLDATLTDDSGTSASVTGASYPAGERRTIGVNVGDGELFCSAYDGSSHSPVSRAASVSGLSAFNIETVTLFQGGDVTAYGLMVAAPADLTAGEAETNISDLHNTYKSPVTTVSYTGTYDTGLVSGDSSKRWMRLLTDGDLTLSGALASVERQRVGGGAGGGGRLGGGGGSGGGHEDTAAMAAGTYAAQVGDGGTGGNSSANATAGQDTTFDGKTALGGGPGGTYTGTASGQEGGSGGGACGVSGSGGAGLQPASVDGGFGNSGGAESVSNAGGGGGAGTAGQSGGAGGLGGSGRAAIGSGNTYARGGDGNDAGGEAPGTSGGANTGDGGTGGNDAARLGGDGGSGVIELVFVDAEVSIS